VSRRQKAAATSWRVRCWTGGCGPACLMRWRRGGITRASPPGGVKRLWPARRRCARRSIGFSPRVRRPSPRTSICCSVRCAPRRRHACSCPPQTSMPGAGGQTIRTRSPIALPSSPPTCSPRPRSTGCISVQVRIALGYSSTSPVPADASGVAKRPAACATGFDAGTPAGRGGHVINLCFKSARKLGQGRRQVDTLKVRKHLNVARLGAAARR
jgi:hypothetical protein